MPVRERDTTLVKASATKGLWLQSMRGFAAGHIGGMAGLVAGQPFDTIKVRMQAAKSNRFQGFTHAVRAVTSKSGLTALYRGLESPMLMVGIQKATVFSAYTTAFTYLQRKDPETRKANVAKAGIFAGVVGSVLLGPVDQLKIAMQIQKGKGDAVKTFRSTVTDLYGAHGFVRGIYGGYQSVFVREIVGYAIYFSVFDGLTQAWKHKYSTDNTISFTGQLLVGGTTGTVCWSLYYPLDVIKSRAHVWSMTAGKPALSFPKVAETIYKTRGVAGFYQGMLPAVIRGFPTHATVLTSYGLLMKWLPGAEEDTE